MWFFLLIHTQKMNMKIWLRVLFFSFVNVNSVGKENSPLNYFMRLRMNTINDLILQFHLKLLDMIKRKDIFLISLFVSLVAPSLNAEATKLEDGFYFGSTLKDSVDVSSSNENLVIIFSDGSKYSFDRKDKTAFYKKNISNDGETLIQVIDSENFKILHNQNTENIKPYSKYTLYKKPGFLNKVIAALVTSALLFSLFQFYLIHKLFYS